MNLLFFPPHFLRIAATVVRLIPPSSLPPSSSTPSLRSLLPPPLSSPRKHIHASSNPPSFSSSPPSPCFSDVAHLFLFLSTFPAPYPHGVLHRQEHSATHTRTQSFTLPFPRFSIVPREHQSHHEEIPEEEL
eukprot:TRINITY_DN4194_c0_g1_i1.p2 TRINITY_DN4194_c0_g1~~TRINITY_DN4194_c0_g1_i1.p2  ORF type:complete len:132 (+),score=2.05 TRINITY_DN4194_c0_g1_i1:616-1011(+)